MGNKQRFAGEIARYFPVDFNMFYEPFLGSGALMATVAPKNALGSDIFEPVIQIWKMLVNNPDELIEWYTVKRRKIESRDKKEVYEEVLASYNSNPNGADFLFLSRTCYGGIIRFRKADGYMSTPCG
ncbi:MAG: DNA adenine methylase, partial [Balneolaceae bacterium]